MQGAGTYMFRIDDKRVIDATRAGSIAHLINHSCEVCSINSIYTTIACFLRNILSYSGRNFCHESDNTNLLNRNEEYILG